MVKVGTRFIDLSPEHLELSAQLGVEGGAVRLECFPGFQEQGRPDPSELKRIIARFVGIGMDIPGIEIRRDLMAGALRGDAALRAKEITRITESMRVAADHGIDLITTDFAVSEVANCFDGKLEFAYSPNTKI